MSDDKPPCRVIGGPLDGKMVDCMDKHLFTYASAPVLAVPSRSDAPMTHSEWLSLPPIKTWTYTLKYANGEYVYVLGDTQPTKEKP